MREVNERYNPFEPPGADDGDLRPDLRAFPGHERTASLGQRLAAAVVDVVVMTVSAWLLALAGLSLASDWVVDLQLMAQMGLAFIDIYAAAFTGFVYYLLLQGYLLARYGQTIGKRALGIRIVKVADGERASFWRIVLLRLLPAQLVVLVPGIGIYLALIDVLAIFRKDRRCIHDLIAGTRVVVVERS